MYDISRVHELWLKFGWNLLSLKASRTPSKIDDISRDLAGVDDDFDVLTRAVVLDDIMIVLHMPFWSYV